MRSEIKEEDNIELLAKNFVEALNQCKKSTSTATIEDEDEED